MLSTVLIFVMIWFITFFLFIRAWMAYQQAEKELEIIKDNCQKYKNSYTNLYDKFYEVEILWEDRCCKIGYKLREKPLEDEY